MDIRTKINFKIFHKFESELHQGDLWNDIFVFNSAKAKGWSRVIYSVKRGKTKLFFLFLYESVNTL